VSRQTVKDFRAQNPKIVEMWKKLDEAFKRSTGSDFSMSLPSGRRLRYEKVRCEARIEKDKETSKPVKKTVFTAMVGSKRVITYGGKLTENIVQAVARDVFSQCLLTLDKENQRVLFHVHDEAVVEAPLDVTAERIGEIMGRPSAMLPGMTIASDSKVVPFYLK
jgi:DNA polymerase